MPTTAILIIFFSDCFPVCQCSDMLTKALIPMHVTDLVFVICEKIKKDYILKDFTLYIVHFVQCKKIVHFKRLSLRYTMLYIVAYIPVARQ